MKPCVEASRGGGAPEPLFQPPSARSAVAGVLTPWKLSDATHRSFSPPPRDGVAQYLPVRPCLEPRPPRFSSEPFPSTLQEHGENCFFPQTQGHSGLEGGWASGPNVNSCQMEGHRGLGRAACYGPDSHDVWLFGPDFQVCLGTTRVMRGAKEAIQFWALPPSFIWRPAPALGKFLAW